MNGSKSTVRSSASLPDGLVEGLQKSLPPGVEGGSAEEFLARKPRLAEFTTPLLVLDDAAIRHNTDRMAAWCAEHGVALAPHGKTTMAPALWRRLLDAGAFGITVATPFQLWVAIAAGVRRIILANALVDPVALTQLAAVLDADPDVDVFTWADSPDTVEAMERALAAVPPSRPLRVLVELGGEGGRTGARGRAAALAVADAIGSAEHVSLAGVAGYEGSIAHDATPEGLARVRAYLSELGALHTELLHSGAYPGPAVITAGGSAYFDDVVELLAPLGGPDATVVLRSGAYQIHDDGFYRGISPLNRDGVPGSPFRSAMHVWARVVSRPEPGLALLDAGRRDVPFDEGLPVPQLAAAGLGEPARPLSGEISAVNDQHAFLRLDPDTQLRVGEVVRLGLSHPCTAFDKWRYIPVVADTAPGSDPNPVIIELVRTYF